MRGLGRSLDRRQKLRTDRARLPSTAGKVGELLGAGQFAIPQQICDLLEGALLGQLMHGIAAINQRAGFGSDLRNRRVVDDDAVKAFGDRGHSWRSCGANYQCDTKARRDEGITNNIKAISCQLSAISHATTYG